MPYIKQQHRSRLDFVADQLVDRITSSGELNYAITHIIKLWTKKNRGVMEKPSYENLSRVIADLECIKLEWYLRMMVPYEIKKRDENGDVYGE